MKAEIGGFVRHVAGYAGGALAGYLVGANLIETSQRELVVSIVTGLAVIGWSIWQKRSARKKETAG